MECENTNSTCTSLITNSCVCREQEKPWGGICLFPGWNTTADTPLLKQSAWMFFILGDWHPSSAQQEPWCGSQTQSLSSLVALGGSFLLWFLSGLPRAIFPQSSVKQTQLLENSLSLIFFRWLNCCPQMNIPRISADNTAFDSVTHMKLFNWRLHFYHGHKR